MEYTGTFTGKMNKDVNPSLLPPEDYSDALNFTNNDKEVSNLGGGGRHRGNVLVTNTYAETGDVVIGSAEYVKGGGELIFIRNDVSSTKPLHKILYVKYKNELEYLFESKTIKVLQNSFLNFEDYVDATIQEDVVVFTDGVNEPRMFDIQKMMNYNKFTNNTNQILYHYEELEGIYYDGTVEIKEYFIYEDKVYYMHVPVGTTFTVVPPPNARYTLWATYDENTYYNIEEDDILLIAKPPHVSPSLSYSYDADRKVNNIYGNIFSVTSRFIYNDGRKSVWSPYSNLELPLGQTTFDGYKIDEAVNAMTITVQGGGRNLKGIDIAVKNLSNESSFKIIKTLRNEDSPIDLINGATFNFYNDESYLNLDLKDTLRIEDYVPRLTDTLDILSDGRLLVANNEEGFEDIKTNVGFEIIEDTIDVNKSSVATSTKSLSHDSISFTHYTITPVDYKIGMTAEIKFHFATHNGTVWHETTSITGGYYTEFHTNADKMLHFIRLIGHDFRMKVMNTFYREDRWYKIHATNTDFNINPEQKEEAIFTNEDAPAYDDTILFASTIDATKLGIGSGDSAVNKFIIVENIPITYMISSAGGGTSSISLTIDSVVFTEGSLLEVPTVKSNGTTVLGIRYYDGELRTSSVQKCGSVKTDLLDLGTLQSSAATMDIKYNQIRATINHYPPSWAKYYTFMVMKNRSYTDYFQAVVYDEDHSGTYTKFRLAKVCTDMAEISINWNINPWIVEEGDRIRFIAELNAAVGTLDYTYKEVFDTELLVEEEDAGGNYVTLKNQTTDLKSGDIVEVYRPTKIMEDSESELYFEVDELREIINGKHVGNNQTQTSTLPAIVDINYSDAVIRMRYTFYNSTTTTDYKFYIESHSLSDWYNSKFQGYGRIGVVLDVETNHNSSIRFGGRLLPESSNNFIAKFDWEDYDNLSRQYGSINGLAVVGDTIIVFQDKKITSFYINKTVIKQADGGQQTILSDKVLNNKSVSEFDYGCINMQSIVKRDTHVLFFDAINGNFVRHSKNGLVDISAYGISEFSKELGKATIAGVIDLVGAYNEYNEQFYWLIKFTPIPMPDPIPPPVEKHKIEKANAYWKDLFQNGDVRLAITFDDKQNAWKSFVEMGSNENNVEYIGVNSSYLSAFAGGHPYIYDSSKFGWAFDEARETTVEKIINVQPLEVKVFNYLEVNSQDEWKPNEDGDVKTENQQSRIRMMRDKEGHFYSEYKRNTLYPNGTSRPDEHSGEVLRGNVCSVNLRLAAPTSDSEAVQSTIVNIKSGVTLSEK